MKVDKGPVIIGWLMGGQSSPGFVASLAALTAISGQYGVNLLGAIPKVSGPRIAAARNALVRNFLATDGEWLFMVDDDMVFQSNALAELLKTADKKERPVVGGFAYAAGRDGYFSTIWTLDEDRNPVRVDDYPPGEVLRVVGTGAACLLVHRKVFEKIEEKYGDTPWPWFQETSLRGHTVGEDFTFCIRVGEAGFPIHVDTSIEFGHEKTVNIDRDFVANWRQAHRVVVTGTGRCGTGYMARVLTRAAIPSTHEGVYNPQFTDWSVQRVESSWLAAPFLPQFEGHVVHLVRHPLAVINSLVGVGFFTDELRALYADHARHFVDMEGLSEVEQAMKFYVEWNRMIEPFADQFVKVEEADGEIFAMIAAAAGAKHSPTDFQEALKAIPTDWNHGDRAELTWDDLPAGDLKSELETMAKEYGYDI